MREGALPAGISGVGGGEALHDRESRLIALECRREIALIPEQGVSRAKREGVATLSRDSPTEPGDEVAGQWTRAQLEHMNARFVAAMERAIARGEERLPGGDEISGGGRA